MRSATHIQQKMPKSKTFSVLWRMLWPEKLPSARIRLILALMLLVLAKIFLMATPLTFKYAVDGLERLRFHDVFTALLFYTVFRVAASLSSELRDIIFAKVTQRSLRESGIRVFKHLHELSLRFHLDRQTGGLTRIIERGTKGVESLLNFLSMLIIPTLVEVILATIAMMWLFDWRYALCTASIMIVYVVFTLKLTEWRIKFVKAMNQADNQAQTRAIDSLINYETVKYFGNERHEIQRFDEFLKSYEGMALQSRQSMNYLNFGQAAIISFGLGILLWMGVTDMQAGTMSLGDVVAINTYLLQLYIPLNNLGFAYREVKVSAVNFEEMLEVMDQPCDVIDALKAKPIKIKDTSISFDHVSFSYDANRSIIHDLSFMIPAGQTLAIVGTTGAGKSTLSKLLFRFYDPTGGCIKIGGVDIKTVTQDSVRALIGMVPQDTVLFNDTILYNIQYGRPDASQAEVVKAAEQAKIHDFIISLPDGYATRVGERGLKLSGGEKQRVAIARALLKQPKIFVFDEATSSLDTRTERDIQRNLNDVSKNFTTLIIAHRLSTIVHADQIIVMDAGRIVEQGSHQDLLTKGGVYYAMWQRQQQDGRDAE